jgi:hypothetical protein
MEFTHEFLAFKGALGMGAVILKGGFPEGKGMVERANRYLETSFLPGRSFTVWVPKTRSRAIDRKRDLPSSSVRASACTRSQG